MNPIGGYFSLELPRLEEYHKDALCLNTGRNCLEYILISRGYKKVFIPCYVCDVILEPFRKLDVQYEFFRVDDRLEIKDSISLNPDEALLYVNYFGLKQHYVECLADVFGNRLIVDNTQAFYAKPVAGIDTFYSCRKFFGVPDGSYLYTDKTLDVVFEQDKSYDRMSHLCKRIELGAESGYVDFRMNDERLSDLPIRQMSRLTHRMMQSIDYQTTAQKRRNNYNYLHQHLANSNQLQLTQVDEDVPMVYPYLSVDGSLRDKLIENKIFVAQYWPNVLQWTSSDELEYRFVLHIQHLPVDQRYDLEDMDRILKTVLYQKESQT